MKLAAYLWFYRAIVLALALSPSLSDAQKENEDFLLQQARAAVAKALDRPAADISFEGLKLIPDNLGAIVCGIADGKRFLADATKRPRPPQIEGALSAPMFNFLWNARCRGMSASAATEILKREIKQKVCASSGRQGQNAFLSIRAVPPVRGLQAHIDKIHSEG